jgi:hypothetical protein
MFLLFMEFVFILYSDDYTRMFGDLNIVRFNLLVLIFVVSIIFLIISPNIIGILLGWDGFGLFSYLLVIYCQNVKSLDEERRLKVFENRVLRRVFGPEKDEVTGEWRKLHNEELNDLYSLPNIVRVVK